MSSSFRLAVAASLLFAVCLVPCGLHAQNMFRRGDVDDSGGINLTDPVHLLQALFGGGLRIRCSDAADADDSGRVELTDAVYLLNHLFRRGAPPPAPFPDCGVDPTRDSLGCNRAVHCRIEEQDRRLDTLFEPLDGREAFVFVVDRSGSMQDSGELEFAKRESIRRIESFPEDYEFAIVFFDRGLLQYPEDGIPVRATPEEKDAATRWIDSVPGGRGTCPEAALSAALTALAESAAASKRIIYLGNGGATCNGRNEREVMETTLKTITAQNTEAVVIHAVSIGPLGTLRRTFLQALIDASGGLFVEIEL